MLFCFSSDLALADCVFFFCCSESIQSCPSEEIFLFMLLKSNNYGKKGDNSWLEFAEEALALRRSATLALMRSLQEAIAAQQARSEYLSLALNGEKSNESKDNK